MSTAPSQDSSVVPYNVAGPWPLQNTQAGSFEVQIARVREDLNEWQGKSESQLESVSDAALLEAMQLASDMFVCLPTLGLMVDPEAPEFPFFVISVNYTPALAVREFMSKEFEWFEGVRHLFSGIFNCPRLIATAD